MIRYLLYPLRGAALILVAVFTVGWIVAFKAGLMGIPLALLLTSWFFKYGFILLDAIVTAVHELGQRLQIATPTIDALLGLTRLFARTRGLYP